MRYGAADVDALAHGPVILSVGRFTAVKRVPLLIEAFASAGARFAEPASLVLLGGHPGEREGEHPLQTAERVGAERVFLAGWHEHDELPAFLSASDVLALASVREQFGAVLVEARPHRPSLARRLAATFDEVVSERPPAARTPQRCRARG